MASADVCRLVILSLAGAFVYQKILEGMHALPGLMKKEFIMVSELIPVYETGIRVEDKVS